MVDSNSAMEIVKIVRGVKTFREDRDPTPFSLLSTGTKSVRLKGNVRA